MRSQHTEAAIEKLQVVANTHRVRGENRQAADVYAEILRYSPVDIALRTHLIDLLAQQDRIDESVDQTLELVDLYRQMAEIEFRRGSAKSRPAPDGAGQVRPLQTTQDPASDGRHGSLAAGLARRPACVRSGAQAGSQ